MKYLLLLMCCGCAMTRPHIVEISTATNGVVTKRELWMPAYAVWPATQTIAKERASAGKTLNAGFSEVSQEGSSTNFVEALKVLDSILGKIH